MNNIDLTPLKDLHIMAQPSWWPLAWGWWIIIAGLIFVILCWMIIRRWWHNRPVIYAQNELKKIATLSTDLDFLHALSNLLKRVAILKFGREKIAPLTEEKWQDFLVKTAHDVFTKQQAKQIAFSTYLAKLANRIDRNLFVLQARKWIQQVLKK